MAKKSILRIATRKTPLALWQANYVKNLLAAANPELPIELINIVTTGDKLLGTSLAKIGGKGLFVKELENAMLENQADIAVHSIKDMPVTLPDRFTLAAVFEREDPRDAFVANDYANLTELPTNAVIGTSSLRRACQLKAMRADLQVATLRGAVGTRLQKLDDNKFAAIILAAAGLKRLQEDNRIKYLLTPEQMLPAIGQGAIGIECLQDNVQLMQWLATLEHKPTRWCITAERAMNKHLQGGCQLPIAGYAVMQNEDLYLRGLVGNEDGSVLLKAAATAKIEQAEKLGELVAEKLLQQGAAKLIK